MRHSVGIDVGGTWTRLGLVAEEGLLRAVVRQQTPPLGPAADFVRSLAKAIEELEGIRDGSDASPVVIGLALPGLVDAGSGTLVRSVNLPWLEGYPVAGELSKRCSCRMELFADADAATWGEYVANRQAATDDGRSAPSCFVHLRLGTGVACGLVAGGRIEPIEPNRAGHLSVLVVDASASAPPCRCGKRGCVETIASGHALSQRAQQLGYQEGLPGLESAYRKGHPAAITAVAQAAEALSKAITNIADHLKPEAICLGGGVLGTLPSLLVETLRRFDESFFSDFGVLPFRRLGVSCQSASLQPALLADDAGLLGAALLACRTVSRRAPL